MVSKRTIEIYNNVTLTAEELAKLEIYFKEKYQALGHLKAFLTWLSVTDHELYQRLLPIICYKEIPDFLEEYGIDRDRNNRIHYFEYRDGVYYQTQDDGLTSFIQSLNRLSGVATRKALNTEG